MRNVLAAMSVGFPLVLVIAWFFDISSEGVTRTLPRADGEDLPMLNLGDHALFVGLLAVLALNTYVLSSPAPGDATATAASQGHTIAILPFEDVGDQDAIGDAIAGELRGEFQRLGGLRVLGTETSRAIAAAGDARTGIASELGISSLLMGDVRLENGQLDLRARVLNIPAGNIVWQADFTAPVGDGPDLQRRVVKAIIDAVIPTASADTAIDSRIGEGECGAVYDTYLHGKQIAARGTLEDRKAAVEMMQEAVSVDPQCGVAWEAIAILSIDWSKEGFAKAGAAARRALEINESLAGAWATLAEIAEEEARWSEAERLFLRALYVSPTDGNTNAMYAETLLARGRVRDALHYALEGYRYEPASARTNHMVLLTARYAGEADLTIKHERIFAELRGNTERYGWAETAEALIIKGEIEQAATLLESRVGEYVLAWYPQCVRSLADPALRDGLVPRMQEVRRQTEDGELTGWLLYYAGWHVIRCATWLGETDIVIEMMASEETPTEVKFIPFFQADSGNLRQTEYFRNLVVERGLLDYWREWGWSDYCRPDGDSFVCD
jgi:TolB-like protein